MNLQIYRGILVAFIEQFKYYFGREKCYDVFEENGGKKYTFPPIDVTRREFSNKEGPFII